MIPFGTQYYRPPTPKQEFWEDDFKLMKECGFNTIRGWAMWNWLNPRKGEYDFAEVDRLLDLGEKYDIKVILLVNLESSPAWLFKQYPDKLYVSRLGESIKPHVVHNTSIGGFPGQCLDYKEIKAEAVEFITKLVQHCKDHPALMGWEPHNEPLHEPARYHHEVFCYCSATTEAFRDWLKKKYDNSIDKLNVTWKNKYGDFDEIFPPNELGSFADWMDWRTFAIDSLVGQDAWRVETIRENDSGHPVMMHTRAGGDRRDIVCDCTDDWQLSKLVDKFGFANFPQGKTIFEHILSGDVCRCAAQGKEFWMHELQSGPFGIGLQRNNPFFKVVGSADSAAKESEVGAVTPERLALWSLLPFAQGAKGLLYWQFRTEQYGAECGFNLVGLDGKPLPRLEMAKRLANFINENEELISKAMPPASKVAIGFSVHSVMMTYFAETNLQAYMDAYLGANRLLQHAGHQLDVVRLDNNALDDDFEKYNVIVLPFPIFSDEVTAGKLKKFVANGGTLISEASFAQYDGDCFTSDKVPGMGLDEVFGCHREEITSKYEVNINYKGLPLKSRFYEEFVIPHEGAEVVARYENGQPAAVTNRYGKGKAVYFGTNVLMDYLYNEDENLLKIISEFTGNAYRFAKTDNKMAITRYIQYGDKKLVFLFNGINSDICCTMTLDCEVGKVTDIFNKEEVDFETYKGVSKKTFWLKPYAVKVFMI